MTEQSTLRRPPVLQGTGRPTVRVLIVDGQQMMATSLALALQREVGIAVPATVNSLAAARALVSQDPPDVVLLDQRLPDESVVEAIIELRRLAPRSRVVLLVASSDDAVLVAATQAGAAGFVATTSPVEELVAAVRAAAAGDVLISPVLLPRLLARLQAPTVRGDGQQLTAREREVLELIAEGLSNAAIAARLVLSVNTVRNHVQNLLTKLGAHSKLEALSVAVRDGLLPLRRF